jgi:thiol-disulfide isomerase/thioredoxin
MVNERTESIKWRAKTIKKAFHDPMLESLLDEYVNYGLNDKQMSYTLPDCEATTILRKITDKYKGKYLYIDFWATFCGPCRGGIEESKTWREELRNNPDFEFIFITGDKDSPKKDFDEYVAENLNGAEVYRIPQAEYNKLMELFKFSGIPQYEALDRNGNVLKFCNKYRDGGKEQFLKNIELLKKLEK